MKQLFIGLIAEGTTDIRFLKSVIFKSIQELSWQCDNQVEIFDIREISAEGDSFVEKMLNASKCAWQEYGISALCIHADSDARSLDAVMQSKFEPFFSDLEGKIGGKKVALFGSYDWGDGDWMRSWCKRAGDAGALLVMEEGLICNNTPDDEGLEACLHEGAQ